MTLDLSLIGSEDLQRALFRAAMLVLWQDSQRRVGYSCDEDAFDGWLEGRFEDAQHKAHADLEEARQSALDFVLDAARVADEARSAENDDADCD